MAFVPFGGNPRPYRDFLTPSLHRRFSDASLYTLFICYIYACWMGETSDWIWLWFPIGPAGARTLLLFIPAITVYILRVAQWHVGMRNTQTPAETFSKYFLRKATILTIAFYVASSWVYSEIYIWTRAEKARLEFTDAGRFHERIRLNERPLYLRFMFITLALVQAGVHLWKDYDEINVRAMKPKKDVSPTLVTISPRSELFKNLGPKAIHSGILVAITFSIGSFAYFALFRQLIWYYYHSFMRTFISLSKNSRPTGLPPFLSLAGMFLLQGAMLVFLWQFINLAFDLYIAQPPLKKDKPITSDSKDPNGSLLNGLKSKKDAVKAIAFWELAIISFDSPDRRKTIYSEYDRKKGATFTQITSICLAELRLLIKRLNSLDPNDKPEDQQAGPPKAQGPIALVPQISQPLKDGEIKGTGNAPTTVGEKFGAFAADVAKSHSSPQNPQHAYAKQWAKKSIMEAEKHGKQAETWVSEKYTMLVRSPLGWPFRQSLQRNTRLIVTGAPYSRLSLICNAITALTNLTMFSLKEDECGLFQAGIPDIVRVLTSAIQKLEAYIQTAEVHWSDFESMEKPEAERRNVPEAEEVKKALKDGLEKVLGAFNEYLGNLGLSRVEILEAKKAASSGPQMVETGR